MKGQKEINSDSEKFLLRIDKDLKTQAEVRAKEQERSLNRYIVNLVKEDIKK